MIQFAGYFMLMYHFAVFIQKYAAPVI